MRLRLGISTCPNDTFVFHAILNQKIDLRGFHLDIELLDVQELNEGLLAGRFDASKASFHAALHLAGEYGVLRSGASMGLGAGPLVVTTYRREMASSSTVLCPGRLTSATLLFQCLHPDVTDIKHHLFSELADRLLRAEGDFAVLIHEGRFTYQRAGLLLVEDLGTSWEQLCGGPLPLGGILARHDLGDHVHRSLSELIAESLSYAYANRGEALQTITQYAQELDEEVIWPYVELYVNEYTRDLGAEGEMAIGKLDTLARRAQVTTADAPPVRVLA